MLKSVILAAGKGTRMKSETPKVLHTIFDKTLVGYVIDAVNGTGLADENFVIVGHQAERLQRNYEGPSCFIVPNVKNVSLNLEINTNKRKS